MGNSGWGCSGGRGTTASTLRAACVGVDTNAPFTAAVQLAKDLNKQASTKYLEQPGLCLSVFLLCSPIFTFFCFCFGFAFFFIFFCNCYSTGLLKLNLLSWSRVESNGLLGFLFSVCRFLRSCLFTLCFFRVPKCQTVPCRTCSANSFLWLWENTRRKTSKLREKKKLTDSFNWTESKV